MPNSVKTRKVLDALHLLGFQQIRQKGSHLFFEHPDKRTTLVPLHKENKDKIIDQNNQTRPKNVKRGLLQTAWVKQACIAETRQLFKKNASLLQTVKISLIVG